MMHHNTLAAIVRRLPLVDRWVRPAAHDVTAIVPDSRRVAMVTIVADGDQDDCLAAAEEYLESRGLTVSDVRWSDDATRETILAWVRL